MHNMRQTPPHPLAVLAQERLGNQPLLEWVEAKHAEVRSWEKTAQALFARTEVFVSRETLRRWLLADQEQAA